MSSESPKEKETASDIEQVVLSKYFFQQGQEHAGSHGPYSSGLAVSLFQDAVEMMLWAIAKHVDADFKGKQPAFEQYWDIIRDTANNPHKRRPPLKAKMADLNKARVNFKHYGQVPREEDAIRFEGYAEVFLSESTKEFFELDWNTISLVSLIRSQTIRQLMKEAEECKHEGDYRGCVERCAASEHLISDFLTRRLISSPRNQHLFISDRFSTDRKAERTLRQQFHYIDEYLNELRALTVVALFRIDLSRSSVIQTLMPLVEHWANGRLSFRHKRESDYSNREADLCCSYVTELALKVQKQLEWDSYEQNIVLQRPMTEAKEASKHGINEPSGG